MAAASGDAAGTIASLSAVGLDGDLREETKSLDDVPLFRPDHLLELSQQGGGNTVDANHSGRVHAEARNDRDSESGFDRNHAREVSGTDTKLIECIQKDEVLAPDLVNFHGWQVWRQTEGRKPTLDVDGAVNQRSILSERALWQRTMASIYGDEWVRFQSESRSVFRTPFSVSPTVSGAVTPLSRLDDSIPWESPGPGSVPSEVREKLLRGYVPRLSTLMEFKRILGEHSDWVADQGEPLTNEESKAIEAKSELID